MAPNVFFGRRLMEGEARKALHAAGFVAVLDLAVEFAEPAAFRGLAGYTSLPLLDGAPVEAAALDRCVAWVQERRGRGPVYIHCALGHGRSSCPPYGAGTLGSLALRACSRSTHPHER